jgi:hypothetical protein
MLYNQGTGAIPVVSARGLLRHDVEIEADANHYWAEYITVEGLYVFTTTVVFDSYEVYLEMDILFLAGEMGHFMGFPDTVQEGHHGYVHNPADMYVDLFVVNEE